MYDLGRNKCDNVIWEVSNASMQSFPSLYRNRSSVNMYGTDAIFITDKLITFILLSFFYFQNCIN